MLKILFANISILGLNKDIQVNPINKEVLILTITNEILKINKINSLNNLLAIKHPFFIKNNEKEIIVKDIKKNITYKIIIHNIIDTIKNDFIYTTNNSKNKRLLKQEDNVKQEIILNFQKIFPNIKIIKEEYITPYWNIDILGINNQWDYIIIEIKKRSTDINTINQVCKYWDYFEENNKNYKLYVIWVKNNKKNKDYALKKEVIIIDM